MKKLILGITLAMLLLFIVPVMAGSLTKNTRYESSGVFEIKVLEVRDTRGTLGYQTYDKWRYRSTDGNRYIITVDYGASTFHNCAPDDYMHQNKVTARAQGDWSWTAIKILAKDRMKPFSYRLRVRYKQQ